MAPRPPDTLPKRRRGGGRAGRAASRDSGSPARAPYIARNIGCLEVLSDEGLSLIERNADIVLRETGMEFHDDPGILDIFRNAGCDVSGTRVRFDPGFCRGIIQATARRNSPSTRAIGKTASASAGAHRFWRRPGGRRSCMIWIGGGAMARSAISPVW